MRAPVLLVQDERLLQLLDPVLSLASFMEPQPLKGEAEGLRCGRAGQRLCETLRLLKALGHEEEIEQARHVGHVGALEFIRLARIGDGFRGAAFTDAQRRAARVRRETLRSVVCGPGCRTEVLGSRAQDLRTSRMRRGQIIHHLGVLFGAGGGDAARQALLDEARGPLRGDGGAFDQFPRLLSVATQVLQLGVDYADGHIVGI